MTLPCNINCMKISSEDEDLTSYVWLPGVIDFDRLEGIHLSSEDKESRLYNLTTLYMKSGENYIVDVPYETLEKLFIKFKGPSVLPQTDYNPDIIHL